jgi:hypothetical protein
MEVTGRMLRLQSLSKSLCQSQEAYKERYLVSEGSWLEVLELFLKTRSELFATHFELYSMTGQKSETLCKICIRAHYASGIISEAHWMTERSKSKWSYKPSTDTVTAHEILSSDTPILLWGIPGFVIGASRTRSWSVGTRFSGFESQRHLFNMQWQ